METFTFSLELRHFDWPVAPPLPAEEVVDGGSVMQVFDHICDYLEDHRIATFQVIFGAEAWPVDTRVDASVFLEQLPEFAGFLRGETDEAKISFYEQGIERDVILTSRNGSCHALCKPFPWIKWRPDPAEVGVERDRLLAMFRETRTAYLSVVAARFAWVLSEPYMVDWMRGSEC